MSTSDPTSNPELKRCSACRELKPLPKFSRNARSKDGLRVRCKDCAKVAYSLYYAQNKERWSDDTSYESSLKLCGNCQEWKHHSEFFRSRGRPDGLSVHCKKCYKTLDEPKRLARRKTPKRDIYNLDAGTKCCIRCKEWKPYDDFAKDRTRKLGLKDICKKCSVKNTQDYYDRNAEEVKLRRRQRYAIGPEKDGLYYQEHREDIRAKTTERRAEHPEKRKVEKQKHRAQKRSLPNILTDADWQHALEYFNHRCAVCGRPRGLWHTLAADHWIPLSDPRPNNPGTVPWNIVPLCHGQDGCNNSKGRKDPEMWLIARYGKRKAKQVLALIQLYFDSLIKEGK